MRIRVNEKEARHIMNEINKNVVEGEFKAIEFPLYEVDCEPTGAVFSVSLQEEAQIKSELLPIKQKGDE